MASESDDDSDSKRFGPASSLCSSVMENSQLIVASLYESRIKYFVK